MQALSAQLQRQAAWRACGKNGVTAREALEQVLPAIPEQPVDLALVAFGINDTTAFRSAAAWRCDLANVLQALDARCKQGLVIVSGVPPVSRFPALPQPLRWVLGLKAGVLDRVARELAPALPRTLYVPLLLDPQNTSMMAVDGYHPSALGCAAWAQLLAKACPLSWRVRSNQREGALAATIVGRYCRIIFTSLTRVCTIVSCGTQA